MKQMLVVICIALLLPACTEPTRVAPPVIGDSTGVTPVLAPPEAAPLPAATAASGLALRYLYFANGGVIGYYTDGSVRGCPRCDFCDDNIAAMSDRRPHANYTVESDGSLLVDGERRAIPASDSAAVDDGWAMIDSRWLMRPQSCK